MDPRKINIKDYSYSLPEERIAKYPLAQRDASKLLVYRNGEIRSDFYYNITDHLPANSLIVFNNTRVVEARLLFQKSSGGIIEVFCLEPFDEAVEISLGRQGSAIWKCLIGGASKWKHGLVLEKQLSLGTESIYLTASFVSKQDDHFLIRFSWNPGHFTFSEVLHAAGAIPLPPYIKRKPTSIDEERYQTVYGIHEGSVAAPTSSLHFTDEVFQSLSEKNIKTSFITLHVGAGTFKPVKTKSLEDHLMHEEPFRITQQLLKDLIDAETIIAAGTTSLRTLESVYWLGIKIIKGMELNDWKISQWEAYDLDQYAVNISYKQSMEAVLNKMKQLSEEVLHCSTSLIIVPGYKIRIPSALITNFHQPQSTLLLLVAAFIGDDWKKVYSTALESGFRFLSYGDSSLLWKRN